jgi:hypothetical protein
MSSVVLNTSEYAYVLKYAEEREPTRRGKYEPWTVRKFALYHSFDLCKRRSVYILVSPNQNSRAKVDAMKWMEEAQNNDDVYNGHFAIHDLLLSYHIENWKPYVNFYEKQMLKLVR